MAGSIRGASERAGPARARGIDVLLYAALFHFPCASAAPLIYFSHLSPKETDMANARDERPQGQETVGGGAVLARAAQPPSPPDLERDLATIRLPLEEATTLPARLYHDPAIYRQELRDIFSKMWLCIGREEDIEKPGDFLTRTVGQ